jgi:hypothetical protein
MNSNYISSNNKTQKIFVVDMCTWKGHHEIYFKNILLTLLSSSYIVYASCEDNVALKEWIDESNLQNCYVLNANLSFIDKLSFKFLSLIDGILMKLHVKVNFEYSSIVSLLFIKNFLKQIGEEVPVFFAHADSAIPHVPAWFAKLVLPSSWIALSIQPSYQLAISLGKQKSRQRFLAEKLFSLPSCKAVLVLHPVYQIFFNKRFKQNKFLVFPELVDVNTSGESELVDKVQYLASGRKIISIVGSLLPKRNLKLFLKSAQNLSASEYFILVVGYLSKECYSAEEIEDIQTLSLTFPSNSYIDLNYYIPNEREFNKLLDISDVIYLQYQNHSCSSNILPKSIKLRKPIIVNSGYLMEKVVKTYDWQTISPEEPEKVSEKIIDLAHTFKINEEKYNQFLAEYDGEKNTAAIYKSLEFL